MCSNKRESLQAHAARRQQQELQDSLFRVERESARLVQQSGWKSGHGSTAVLHRLYEEGLRTVASKREAPDAPPQSYLENWSCARCGTFHRLPASHRIASPVRRPGSVVASGNQPTGTRDSASPGRASPIDSTPSPNGRSPGIRRTKRTAIVFNMQRLPPLVCDTCGFRQGAAAYDTPTTGGLRTTSAELDNTHPRSKSHVHPAHQACVPDETFQPQLPARTVEIIELAQAQAKGVGVTAGSAPMGEYFRLRPDERLHRGVRPVAPSAIKLATVLPTPPPGDQLGTDLDCAAADLPPAPPSVEAAAQRELVKRLAYEAKDRAKEREAQAAALHARDPSTGRPLFHPRIRHTPPSFQRGMTSVSNRRDHYATQARNEEHLEALRREQERKDKDLHHLAEKCTGIRSQKLVEKARMRTENDLFRTLVERWGGPAGHLRLVDVPVEALLPEVAEIVQAVRFEQLRTVDDVASASALDLPTWRHLLLAASDRSASTGDACRLLVPESRLQQQRQVLRLLAQGLSADSAQIQGLLKPSHAEVAASGNSSAAGTADGLVWREWEQEPLMPYSRAHANAAAAAAAATNPFVPFINPVSARSAGISRAQDARPVEEILQAKGVKTQQELEQARQRILQEEAASLPFAPTVFRPPRALRGVRAKVDAGAPHIAGESVASNEQRRSSPVVRSTKKSSALTLLSHGKSADKLQRAVNIAHRAPPNPVEVVQALKQVAQKPSMAAAAAPASGLATENASLLSSTNGTSDISHYINAPIVMSLPRATAPPLPAEIGAMLVAKALERELGLPATEHVSKEKNV